MTCFSSIFFTNGFAFLFWCRPQMCGLRKKNHLTKIRIWRDINFFACCSCREYNPRMLCEFAKRFLHFALGMGLLIFYQSLEVTWLAKLRLSNFKIKPFTAAKISFGGIYWNQTIYAKWSRLLQSRASSKAFFHDPCWTSSDWYFWDDMKTNITVLTISLQFFVFQKLNSAWGLKKIRQNSAGEKHKKAAKLMTVLHFDITCCGVAQLIWN